MNAEELLAALTKQEDEELEESEELPSTASDVPLSRIGSLYLLATIAASSTFFDAPPSLPHLQLIPHFASILGSSLGDSATGSTGGEPEPLIDAVLFLGFLILSSHKETVADKDDVYNNILQRLSLLSANLPSPVLRYNAHLLSSSTLHAHPEDHFRLAFIRDTLEHCPFENLKASAVGWLKDELLTADRTTHEIKSDNEPTIFATSAVLETLSPFLFPSADTLMEGQSATDAYATFQAYQTFFLTVLNLLFLLLSSPSLFVRLGLAAQIKAGNDQFSGFLQPLAGACRRFRTGILSEEIAYGDEAGRDAALASLELVDVSVQQVQDLIAKISNS